MLPAVRLSPVSEAPTPPTPDGVPVVGNGWAFSRDPVRAMETWAEAGDVVRLTMPGRTMYMVTHPDLIEQVLVSDQDKFSIGPDQKKFFSGAEDHAVTTNTGDRWRRLRRALHPAFARSQVRSYADDMASTTAAFVDEWDDGDQMDLPRQMRLLTVNVLGDTLLDVDLRGREAVVMDAADALIGRANFRRPGQLLPDWVPTPTDRRFRRAVGDLDDFVTDVLASRTDDADVEGDDVCSVLLAAEERGDLSMAEVRHNLVALLLAGHDSPATALTSAWLLLDEHPDVREALVAEYEDVVEGDRPDATALENLDLTRNVVAETLRLYPPTTGVNRQATEPVTLGGYELPEGAQLMIPQWPVHRDERFWADPETFDPDRWDRDGDRPEYAFFPFSGGPRACVGNDFAWQELTLAVATIAGRVDLDVTVDGELTFAPSIQLRPENEITAEVRRR